MFECVRGNYSRYIRFILTTLMKEIVFNDA